MADVSISVGSPLLRALPDPRLPLFSFAQVPGLTVSSQSIVSLPESLEPGGASPVQLLGLGTAAPEYGVGFQEGGELAQRLSTDDSSQHRVVNILYRRTKIANRGSVLLDEKRGSGKINEFYPPKSHPDDRGPSTQTRGDRYAIEAPRLAIASATDALADSGIAADQITHLVTVSCTGFAAPGVDIELINALGLSDQTARVNVGFMGCHGAINGMRAAHGLALTSPNARVLVVSVELCSLHYQYGFDPDRIISGSLFADGSGALVLGQVAPRDSLVVGSSQDSFEDDAPAVSHLAATASCLVPDSRDQMTWTVGDHGFEMTLSAGVPSLIESQLRGFLEEFLSSQGETIESIGGWAVHPGGPRILTAVENGLDLPPEALETSRSVLTHHGNMSSATMLFILQAFAEQNRPKPWLMLGFGPGLEIETALIR